MMSDDLKTGALRFAPGSALDIFGGKLPYDEAGRWEILGRLHPNPCVALSIPQNGWRLAKSPMYVQCPSIRINRYLIVEVHIINIDQIVSTTPGYHLQEKLG